MSLSLAEAQAVTDLAQFLYNFLPGTPFGDTSVSFTGVAHAVGLAERVNENETLLATI